MVPVIAITVHVLLLQQMPKMEINSNAKPSQFAYPPPLEDKKEKAKEKVETAVLSITAKQKKKDAEKKKDEEKMDVVNYSFPGKIQLKIYNEILNVTQ